MIEKERLEELIEQEKTIWTVNKSRNINPVKTNKTCEIQRQYLMKEGQIYSYIEQTFETEEEAKWFAEFGCIERTERLELPTWEELFKQDRLLDCYTQEFCIVGNRSFIGVVLLGVDFTNEIVEVSIGSDKLFVEKLTKENYTLACRKAKELFLKGNVND